MNCCFYLSIDRLPLATVAAIEFLPVIVLAAIGARTRRNVQALALAVAGVYLVTGVHLGGSRSASRLPSQTRSSSPSTSCWPTGWHGTRPSAASTASRPRCSWRPSQSRRSAAGRCCPVLADPVALLAGIGVGVSSSVIPYVTDQLAMARLPRATYALMVSLLPATATVIGVVVLTQVPTPAESAGVALVIAGVALHREPSEAVVG